MISMCHRPQWRRLYRSTLNPLKARSYSTPGLATTSRSASLGRQARGWCRLHHGRFALNWSRGQSHFALKSLGVLMASMDRKSNLRRDDPSSCLISDGWSMSALRRPQHQKRLRAIAAKRHYYSITSSARASSAGGTSSPSAFAVVRLMTRSNLVGACTGRSAGFSPLRMRST